MSAPQADRMIALWAEMVRTLMRSASEDGLSSVAGTTDREEALSFVDVWVQEDIAALAHPAPAAPLDPIDLRSEAALDAFMSGLDSPWHSDESRRSWCRMFLRDAAMGHLRLAAPAAPLDPILAALSEEQRAIVIELIAARQQTPAEWLSDVVMDLGLGRAAGRDYPSPTQEVPA